MKELKADPGCCEECAPNPFGIYFPCNKPAKKVMDSKKDGRQYLMCDWCADTNLRRGMTLIGPYEGEKQ